MFHIIIAFITFDNAITNKEVRETYGVIGIKNNDYLCNVKI